MSIPRKKEIRFHWFYHHKERLCDGCGVDIRRNEGRYVDYEKKKYYCRSCAGLIVIGVDYGIEKSAGNKSRKKNK